MESGEREEIRLLVEEGLADAASSSCLRLCRICHGEEEESSTAMESPCACSGTLKFAHRDCVQRWCEEKGSIVCEICLQAFEPGYTAPKKKKALVDVVVNLSSEGSYDTEDPAFINLSDGSDASASNYADCSPGMTSRASLSCRFVVITFTIVLLIRHFIAVITVGADHNAFSILPVFLLRASGILLPFYLVTRFISAIQQAQHQHQLQQHLTRGVLPSIDGDERR